MNVVYFTRAPHAPLYERYDPNQGRFVKLGDRQGRFAPENMDGAEYRCLGTPSPDQPDKIRTSKDYKPGLFYSETVFVYGKLDNYTPATHDDVEVFCNKVGFSLSDLSRVILPNGWAKGAMTWDYALMFSPPERKPVWAAIRGYVRRAFPNISNDDIVENLYFYEIWMDQ